MSSSYAHYKQLLTNLEEGISNMDETARDRFKHIIESADDRKEESSIGKKR